MFCFRSSLAVTTFLMIAVVFSCGKGADDYAGCVDTDRQRLVERLRALPYVQYREQPDAEPVGVVLNQPGRACEGYRFYTVQALGRADLININGDIVKTWGLPGDVWERAVLLPEGDVLAVGMEDHGWDDGPPTLEKTDDSLRYLARLTWDGELLWRRYIYAHHDVEVTPDDKLLALTFKYRKKKRGGAKVRADQLTILDHDGEVIESISFLKAIEKRPEIYPLDQVSEVNGVIDLLHLNSIQWLSLGGFEANAEEDLSDKVLVCSRHQDRIAIMDWSTRTIQWSWGRGELLGPHDAQLLPNNRIMVFDNGLSRGWSRVVEVDPFTGEIVWEYKAEPPESFYTQSKGSAQRLPNGDTLIADSDNGVAFEVTASGETIWRYVCPYNVGPHGRASIVRIIHHPASRIDALLSDAEEP